MHAQDLAFSAMEGKHACLPTSCTRAAWPVPPPASMQELPCGHFMHTRCFAEYTRYNYTCPICSK